jgi:hypothetical protein
MSEGGMLYLILVVVSFLTFVGTLFWGMLSTSDPRVAGHARTEDTDGRGAQELAPHGALHAQKG